MSTTPHVKVDLTQNLKSLHLPTIRQSYEEVARQAEWEALTVTTVLADDFENEIVLSDEFYSEVSAHRIPTDLEAVKLLVHSPAVLDLFMWLRYRAKGEQRIPLFGPGGERRSHPLMLLRRAGHGVALRLSNKIRSPLAGARRMTAAVKFSSI